MPNFYALAADLIVAVHFMIVLFVVGSLVLVWRGGFSAGRGYGTWFSGLCT